VRKPPWILVLIIAFLFILQPAVSFAQENETLPGLTFKTPAFPSQSAGRNIMSGISWRIDANLQNEKNKTDKKKERSINYKGLISQSFFFLGIENSVRMKDKAVRDELGGPFFQDWFRSAASTKGWNDGDGFVTNLIGHPMQGSISAFIFANNHKPSQEAKFGWNKNYLKAKRDQMIFAFIYSEMFEFGPLSEASLGNLGYRQGDNSWIDHVTTPGLGILWSIGEDAIYHYWIRDVMERNPKLGNVMIIVLNPTRSFANVLSLRYPWRPPLPK